MALNFPTSASDIAQLSRTDVQNALPQSNPFLPNSYLNAIIVAQSARVFDFYQQLEQVIEEMFPDTADGTFLERWGSYVGILRKPATQSTGSITVTGLEGSIIPINTPLTNSLGLSYNTLQSATINSQNITVDNITRSSNTAIVETVTDHLLTNGQTVTISGAIENEYNGTFSIIVTGASEFTYTVSGAPTSPATGSIIANATFASVSIESVDYGSDANLIANSPLTFSTPLSGVNNIALVQQSAIGGGANLETDDDLRARILFRYQNPVALFNVNAIIDKCESVPGVTRVFVESPGSILNTLSVTSITRNDSIATVTTATSHLLEDGQEVIISGADQDEYNITKKVIVIDDVTFAFMVFGSPASPATGTISCQVTIPNGQVIIYFTKDDQENIIPTASEVAAVKDALVNYTSGIKPAHVDDGDVIVLAPTPVSVDFTFTSLSPNTTSMKAAVTANLQAFFRENTTVGQNLLGVAYQAAIYGSIDPETGISVRNFTLSNPSGDITIQTGQLPILGNVTFL